MKTYSKAPASVRVAAKRNWTVVQLKVPRQIKMQHWGEITKWIHSNAGQHGYVSDYVQGRLAFNSQAVATMFSLTWGNLLHTNES